MSEGGSGTRLRQAAFMILDGRKTRSSSLDLGLPGDPGAREGWQRAQGRAGDGGGGLCWRRTRQGIEHLVE